MGFIVHGVVRAVCDCTAEPPAPPGSSDPLLSAGV